MHFIPHTHLYQREPLGFQSYYALVTTLAQLYPFRVVQKIYECLSDLRWIENEKGIGRVYLYNPPSKPSGSRLSSK